MSPVASTGTISARATLQIANEPSAAARYSAAMEVGACCGSFNSTSSSTEVSTAVTIANQVKIFITVFSRRQVAASAPFFKGIIGRFLPSHQPAALGADFEGLPGGQAKLLTQFARQGQLAIFRYNRSHACKVPSAARLASSIPFAPLRSFGPWAQASSGAWLRARRQSPSRPLWCSSTTKLSRSCAFPSRPAPFPAPPASPPRPTPWN